MGLLTNTLVDIRVLITRARVFVLNTLETLYNVINPSLFATPLPETTTSIAGDDTTGNMEAVGGLGEGIRAQ
jgi:hypothetical protein